MLNSASLQSVRPFNLVRYLSNKIIKTELTELCFEQQETTQQLNEKNRKFGRNFYKGHIEQLRKHNNSQINNHKSFETKANLTTTGTNSINNLLMLTGDLQLKIQFVYRRKYQQLKIYPRSEYHENSILK